MRATPTHRDTLTENDARRAQSTWPGRVLLRRACRFAPQTWRKCPEERAHAADSGRSATTAIDEAPAPVDGALHSAATSATGPDGRARGRVK
ncbi:hypothetical protein HPB50_007747 [Hyalomma asiaticum]|uniref:Uncharacterized protein n=1 Tax=Hyalomma asiaticum TaxID=266040 RepID=A0ACB7TEN1_HYAAI|nr:hypothetical protein HPB50_007747 [Hyalomma asiaticum]